MNVTTDTIKRVTITGATRAPGRGNLDPIRATIDNIEPGKGRITIECYSSSWSAYWGSMGDGYTVERFMQAASTGYLVNCLSRGISSTVFSAEALERHAKKTIIERRRGRSLDYSSLDEDEARELWDDVENCGFTDDQYNQNGDVMERLFGNEWRCITPDCTQPNPKYTYLFDIVSAVQQALKQP